MKTRIFFFFIVMLAFAACKPEIDEFSPDQGSADFSKYIALGNSLTAGYADGDLSKTGQGYSFPNLLAGQFKLAGGGAFKQPLMVDDMGLGKRRVLGLSTDCKNVTSLAPVSAGPINPANLANVYSSQGPFNNFGVPGTKSFMATVAGYGNLNPYYGRFMSSPTASLLGDAVAAVPTFYTLWLGGNDVLGYATTGGENCGDSITPTPIFNASMVGIVAALQATGAKGAIGNIPDITTLPYFNTIPAKGLVLDANTAVLLNAAYAAYNAGAQGLGVPQIVFAEGANFFVMQDLTPPYHLLGGLRQMKAGELIRLEIPQDSLKCAPYWGSQKPIPAKWILDLTEVNKVKAAITAYNGIIESLAVESNLALVDFNALYQTFQSGIVYDGLKFNTTFVTGGMFSLDGVHPNPRGNAVIANYWIEAINAKFGSKIPMVNVGDFPGIIFP